jgi:hypothetical protein
MLFLWLSIVIMIPFDLRRLDGDIDSCDDGNRVPIMQRIIDIGKVTCANDLSILLNEVLCNAVRLSQISI